MAAAATMTYSRTPAGVAIFPTTVFFTGTDNANAGAGRQYWAIRSTGIDFGNGVDEYSPCFNAGSNVPSHTFSVSLGVGHFNDTYFLEAYNSPLCATFSERASGADAFDVVSATPTMAQKVSASTTAALVASGGIVMPFFFGNIGQIIEIVLAVLLSLFATKWIFDALGESAAIRGDGSSGSSIEMDRRRANAKKGIYGP